MMHLVRKRNLSKSTRIQRTATEATTSEPSYTPAKNTFGLITLFQQVFCDLSAAISGIQLCRTNDFVLCFSPRTALAFLDTAMQTSSLLMHRCSF